MKNIRKPILITTIIYILHFVFWSIFKYTPLETSVYPINLFLNLVVIFGFSIFAILLSVFVYASLKLSKIMKVLISISVFLIMILIKMNIKDLDIERYAWKGTAKWTDEEVLALNKENEDEKVILQKSEMGTFGNAYRVVRVNKFTSFIYWAIDIKSPEKLGEEWELYRDHFYFGG